MDDLASNNKGEEKAKKLADEEWLNTLRAKHLKHVKEMKIGIKRKKRHQVSKKEGIQASTSNLQVSVKVQRVFLLVS